VLNDIERWGFLVKPAREDTAPALVGLLDVELNEGAGQLLLLPRRRGFTGAQPNDHIFPSRRLSRMQRDVLHDPVALIEDAEHCNALRHRCDFALAMSRRGSLPCCRCRSIPLLSTLAASGECKRNQ
jgi:hypothetical protein